MGILDSLLKKKGESTVGEGEVDIQPPVSSGSGKGAKEKLKLLLEHLDKIILGLVLIAVAVLSVLQLLTAKKELGDLAQVDTDISLGGKILEKEDLSGLNKLVERSMQAPDAISLKGTNHLVFNPRRWKEITLMDTGEKVVAIDSISNRLGISALVVESIRPLKTRIIPKAFLGSANTVRYEFGLNDSEYLFRDIVPQEPYRTFFGTTNFFAQFTSTVKRGWLPNPKHTPEPIHGFTQQLAFLQRHPEWEVSLAFKGASQPTPQDIQAALGNPDRMIPRVIFDLDVVFGQEGGGYVTNSLKQTSGTELSFTRGFVADMAYKTQYINQKIAWKGYRKGRRLMIDGEVFLIVRVESQKVLLQADPIYGGNGKIYEKALQQNAALNANPVQPDAVGIVP